MSRHRGHYAGYSNIAQKVSAAAQLLEDHGKKGLAEKADRIAEVIESGFNYQFLVAANEGSSEVLNGAYRINVARETEGKKSRVKLIIYAAGNVHTYVAEDEDYAKAFADDFDGKTTMFRIKLFPVGSNRNSGPQETLMIRIQGVGKIVQTTDEGGSGSEKVVKLATSSFNVESAMDYLMGIKHDSNIDVVNAVRTDERTIVLKTSDGEGLVMDFNLKESKPGAVKFSCLTRNGPYKSTVKNIGELREALDEMLTGG